MCYLCNTVARRCRRAFTKMISRTQFEIPVLIDRGFPGGHEFVFLRGTRNKTRIVNRINELTRPTLSHGSTRGRHCRTLSDKIRLISTDSDGRYQQGRKRSQEMRTKLSISLPFSLELYARTRVRDGEYSSISEYIRELIRIDQRMQQRMGPSEPQFPRSPGPAPQFRRDPYGRS